MIFGLKVSNPERYGVADSRKTETVFRLKKN